MRILIPLLAIPIIEIAVLISVGGWLGVTVTIGLVLATAVLGTFLLRQQGFSLLVSAQQQVAQGQLPARTLVEGIALAVGGALLLTPGFVTDGIGFLCLFPATRRWLVTYAEKRAVHLTGVYSATSSSAQNPAANGASGTILDGEYKKEP